MWEEGVRQRWLCTLETLVSVCCSVNAKDKGALRPNVKMVSRRLSLSLSLATASAAAATALTTAAVTVIVVVISAVVVAAA